MKIALPTNDRKTLAKRSGRAKEFAVYEIIDSEVTNIQYFENKHEHHDHDENEHDHSHEEIVDIIKDVDLLIMSKVGKHLKTDIEATNINYKIVSIINIDDILSGFL